jgi:sugar phosphate isomerase/epimerase
VLPALVTDTVTPDLDRALHYALLWGMEGVALRTIGGPGDRVPHVNEARLRRRLEEAELPAVAVDPGLFEGPVETPAGWLNDLAAFDETLSFCKRIGSDMVIVGALAGPAAAGWDARVAGEAIARVASAAARAGVRVAVRNAASTRCASGEDLAALLGAARAACADDRERAALGAAWSPADALEAGADAARGLAALGAAGAPVYCVVVRDGRSDGGWEEATPGEGGVGWAHQLEVLAAARYEGPLCLEVRRRPAGPEGLRASVALIALVRAARTTVVGS